MGKQFEFNACDKNGYIDIVIHEYNNRFIVHYPDFEHFYRTCCLSVGRFTCMKEYDIQQVCSLLYAYSPLEFERFRKEYIKYKGYTEYKEYENYEEYSRRVTK